MLKFLLPVSALLLSACSAEIRASKSLLRPQLGNAQTAAPFIVNVMAPANGTSSLGQNLDFTVNFSKVVHETGSTRLAVQVGASLLYAQYYSGSDSSTFVYRYTVGAGDTDSDGIQLISPLNLNLGTVRDLSGQDSDLSFSPPDTSLLRVSSSVPTLLSISPPLAGQYGNGIALDFIANFSSPVNIVGTPRLQIDIGGISRFANYFSGDGTAAIRFRYLVANPDTDSNGIGLTSPVDLNGGTIKDAGLQNATLNFTVPSLTSVLVDAIPPALSLTSLNGGQVLSGGASVSITWTASDINLAASPISISYSTDSGATFTAIPSATAIANSGTFTWTLPSIDSATVMVRVQAVDTYGNSSFAVSSASFSIGTNGPIFIAAQMTVNSGATITTNPYGLLSLQASDAAVKITHFCIQKNSTAAPIGTSSCWTPVNGSPPGLTPALNLNLSNYSTLISYVPGNYTLYAWAKDELGHMSTLTASGLGTTAQDKVAILYDPKTPPVPSQVWATNNDTGTNPPVQADQSIPIGNSVFIRWNATAANGFSAGPIKLDYTTDDVNYTAIGTVFSNASNGGCTVDASHTGCYTWTSASPTSSYYRIRVTAQDSANFSSAALSGLVNSPKLRLIAGNTYEGIGTSAAAGVITPRDDNPYGFTDHSNLVVVPDGRMFIRDKKGILMVDPANGNLKLLIKTTGSRTGMGGAASSATLRTPSQIAYGYTHGLLILDQDAILKLDLTTLVVSVLIGGGAQTTDGVAPLNVQFTNVATDTGVDEWISRDPLIALPNGDVYFKSERRSVDTITSGLRFRVYHFSTTGLVTSIAISGTGYSQNAGLNISDCSIRGMALAFDPVTSAVSKMIIQISAARGACQYVPGYAAVNFSTGVITGPHPPRSPVDGTNSVSNSLHASLKGDIYAFDRFRIFKYDPTGNSWAIIAGDPAQVQGECLNATNALTCKMSPQGLFVSAQDDVFFLDRNRVRTVDSTSLVRDIYGQSLSFGDGATPLSARFNYIRSFGTSAGKIIVHDENEYRIREINSAQTLISSIAGDGSAAASASSGTALNTPLTSNVNAGSNIAVDALTGDVYFSMARLGVKRLDRSDGLWKSIATFSANYFYPQAFANGFLLMAYATYPNLDNMFELYDKASAYSQTHLIGRLGSNFNHWSADGAIGVNTQARATFGAAGIWDVTNSRWMLWDEENLSIRTITGSTLGTWNGATLGVNVSSFDFDPSSNTVYYCDNTDSRIHKRILGGSATALQWDVPSITCSGTRLFYNSGTSSLYLIYKQGAMYGIAEYLNP